MPPPALVSTTTWWPCATSSRTEVGVRPTRYSWVLTSFGTPTITRIPSPDSCLGQGFDYRGLLAELEFRDLVAMHFVGTVGEAQSSRVAVGIPKPVLVADAAAPMH